MSVAEDIKDRWNGLSPRVKRNLLLVAIAVVFFGVIWAIQPAGGPRVGPNNREVVQHLLNDQPTRKVSLDAMAAQLEDLKKREDEKDRLIQSLKKDLTQHDKAAQGNPAAAGIEMQLRNLERRVGDLQQNLANPTAPPATQAATSPSKPDGDAGRSPHRATPAGYVPPAMQKPRAADLYPATPTEPKPASGTNSGAQPPAPAGPAKPIDFVGGDPESEAETAAAEEADAQRYLPPGTILSGTLITGLDAPTGNNAKKEPFPALLRVKLDAILPNRYRADVRECFLLMGGYGDLSSERAYMRGETISCITKDKQVLESNLPAYAVGEDGKAGIRGRLVSKQGQVIGRALMAGFLEGVSKAFNVNPVPVLQTNPSSATTQYQNTFAGTSSLQAAGLGGVGTAAERIAQFYIDMAGNIFPVIEVDAGRAIDLIAIRGVQLKFHKRGATDTTPTAPNQPGGRADNGLDNMFGFNTPTNAGNPLSRLSPLQGASAYSPLNAGSLSNR